MKDRDFVNRQDSEWIETSQEWLETQQRLEVLKSEEKSLRKALIQMAGNQNCNEGGVRPDKIHAKIPELEGIDLEKYRKGVSEFWRLSAL